MAKTRSESGVFGVPGGDAWSVNPDGVSCTYGEGTSRNSLTNSDYANGGPDGCGYGWREIRNNDGTGQQSVVPYSLDGSRPFKIRPR